MRIFAVLLMLFSAMFLSGCMVDSPKNKSDISNQKPEEDLLHFRIYGRVVKGVVANAKVSLYPYSGGALLESPVAEAFTDAKGYYELRIPTELAGKPALIAADLAGALMSCDLLGGCDGVPFGSNILLDEAPFRLNVGIPALHQSGTYNVSVLTSIAYMAVQSESALRRGDNGVADIEMMTRLSSANSLVASLFGIIGDLPSQDVIDVNDIEERRDAGAAALHYSILNGALLEAALIEYRETDFSVAITRLGAQLKTKGIAGNTSPGSGELTLESITDRQIQTYLFLQQDSIDYSEQLSELYAARGIYLNEPHGQYVLGSASASSSLTSLEKSKKMVEDVRGIALSLNLRKLVELSNLSEFVSGDVGAALEGLGIVIDSSQVIAGPSSDHVVGALVSVFTVTLDVLLKYYQGDAIPSEIDGVRFTHRYQNGNHIIVFNQSVNGCSADDPCWLPVDLALILSIESFGGSGAAQILNIEGVSANLVGSVGDDSYRLFFTGTTSSAKIQNLKVRKGQGDFQGQTLVDIDKWAVNVPFGIESNSDENPVSLDGVFDTSGEKLVVISSEKQSQVQMDKGIETITVSTTELYELRRFLLNVSFSIDDTSDDSFFAAINILQSGVPFSGKAVYVTTSKQLCSTVNHSSCQQIGEESKLDGESAENFVDISASVNYKANLKAFQNPVQIQISGSRQSPTVNNISNLKVGYPGHAVSLNGQFNNNGGITSLDAVNLDGMHLYFDSINGKRVGAVETPSKEKVADIIDMGQWVKIQYINGDFESL